MKGVLKNVKNALKRGWYLFAGGSVVIFIGLWVAFLGNMTDNPIIIVMGFFVMVCGGYLFKRGWGLGTSRVLTGTDDEEIEKEAFIINTKEIVVKSVKEKALQGFPTTVLNTHLLYHVQFEKMLGIDGYCELFLPDDEPKRRFYPPEEMANVVTMPSNKKFSSYQASTFQKVSVGIMALIVGIEVIAIIAVA